MQSLDDFSVIPKCTTLNGYFMLNSRLFVSVKYVDKPVAYGRLTHAWDTEMLTLILIVHYCICSKAMLQLNLCAISQPPEGAAL